MSDHISRTDTEAPEPNHSAKAPWHPPTLEQVDYSETEASGAGGVYDFVVFSGSTGP
jgi:hypothetical protein